MLVIASYEKPVHLNRLSCFCQGLASLVALCFFFVRILAEVLDMECFLLLVLF